MWHFKALEHAKLSLFNHLNTMNNTLIKIKSPNTHTLPIAKNHVFGASTHKINDFKTSTWSIDKGESLLLIDSEERYKRMPQWGAQESPSSM